MNVMFDQLGLFDGDVGADPAQAASARARMRAMIDRLNASSVPPWKNQMGVILDDGAFQRAMRLVHADEAQALWAEFDALMERHYALWEQSSRS